MLLPLAKESLALSDLNITIYPPCVPPVAFVILIKELGPANAGNMKTAPARKTVEKCIRTNNESIRRLEMYVFGHLYTLQNEQMLRKLPA